MNDPSPAAGGPWLASVADIECCMLTTTGRVSGRPHEIEIWFGIVDGTICLISGNGPGADWYRNLRASPRARVVVDGVAATVMARPVDDPSMRRLVGEVMRAKYVWDGDDSIGLTYEAWCFDVPAVVLDVLDVVGVAADG